MPVQLLQLLVFEEAVHVVLQACARRVATVLAQPRERRVARGALSLELALLLRRLLLLPPKLLLLLLLLPVARHCYGDHCESKSHVQRYKPLWTSGQG